MKISRNRYIIRRKSDGSIFCGLARQYHFNVPEEIKNAPIKTYLSKKKAESAYMSSWSNASLDDIEAVEVAETIDTLEG